MKQTFRYLAPLMLWMLAASMAIAGDATLASPPAPQPAVVTAAVAATPATPSIQIGLFTPAPQPAAICPLIGCVNDEYCRRDRDCTTAPGGVCNLFCPTLGCCSYP